MTSLKKKKNIAIVVDTFHPSTTSAAVQMHDLSIELIKLGINVTVYVPNSEINKSLDIQTIHGIEVVEFKVPNSKNVNLLKRALNEFLTPLIMLKNYKSHSINKKKYDGVIWYSPSIFISIFASYICKKSKCNSYLILRDIAPQWYVDMGLMSKFGLPHFMLKIFEYHQYRLANNIGIQSKGDFNHFRKYNESISKKVHVLNNWLSEMDYSECDISLDKTNLKDRKIFIYSGNMGLLQNIHNFLEVIKNLRHKRNIGFIFIGDGSNFNYIKSYIEENKLDNLILLSSIPHNQLLSLYNQCHYGLILLDLNLKTHNIPGKFLSYLKGGLSIFAYINKGNDLEKIIEKYGVGECSTSIDLDVVTSKIIRLTELPYNKEINLNRNKELLDKKFSGKNAASKILAYLGIK